MTIGSINFVIVFQLVTLFPFNFSLRRSSTISLMFAGLFLYSFSQTKAVQIVQALDQVVPVPMPCTASRSVKHLEIASMITVLKV